MQELENIKQNEFVQLTVTQQIMYLLESLSEPEKSIILQKRFRNALLGASLADLFIFKKIGLVDNKIALSNPNRTNFDYLNSIINLMSTLEEKKSVSDLVKILHQKIDYVEDNVKDYLFQHNLLIEKKSKIPFIGSNEINSGNSDLLQQSIILLQKILDGKILVEGPLLYVLAILEAINFLPKIVKSPNHLENARNNVRILMEHEYIPKLLNHAIKENLQVKDDNLVQPQLFIAGMTGIFK